MNLSLWILFGSLPFLALGTLVGTMKRVNIASVVANMIYLVFDISEVVLGSYFAEGLPSWLNFLLKLGIFSSLC